MVDEDIFPDAPSKRLMEETWNSLLPRLNTMKPSDPAWQEWLRISDQYFVGIYRLREIREAMTQEVKGPVQ